MFLLLDTKFLCQFLNLSGRKESRIIFVLPLIPSSHPWTTENWAPLTFGDYQQCVFLVILDASFPFCNTFTICFCYMLILFPFPLLIKETQWIKTHWYWNKRILKKIMNTHISNKTAPKYKEQKLTGLKEEKEK